MNEKLVVRIGGGFTGLDEFIQTNSENEQLKQQRKQTDDFNNFAASFDSRASRNNSMIS